MSRQHRITASNAHRAVSNSDDFLEYACSDGGEYFIQYGHKVEFAFLFYFGGYLKKGVMKIGRNLPWLSATADAIHKERIGNIPIEIKSFKREKTIQSVLKVNYHQLNILMKVFEVPHMYLLTYSQQSKKIQFYRVFKDYFYDEQYLPILERNFYKYMVKSQLPNLRSNDFDSYLTTDTFSKKFLKYCTAEAFSTTVSSKKRDKILTFTEISIKDIIPNETLSKIVDHFNKYSIPKVSRGKMYYSVFEKIFKENNPELLKDFDIQELLVLLNTLILKELKPLI